MAYPRHWLLVFGGSINADGIGGEEWQCGIRGVPEAETDYGQEDATLDNIAPLMSSWFGAATSHMRNDCTLDYLKLNEITGTGHYAGTTTHRHDYATAVPGHDSPGVPYILTCAFSWVTAAARGYAHAGRIYPPVALASQAGMQLGGANTAQFVTSAKNLLAAVAALPSVSPGEGFKGLNPQVVSSHGVARNIEGVRVGSVIDVQRRRKNELLETYATGDWP